MKRTHTQTGRLDSPKARKAADFESREALAKTPSSGCGQGPLDDLQVIDERKAEKLTDAIRTAKFEVHTVAGEWKPTVARWFALADDVKQMVNCIWQTWLVWHVENGSADKQRAWLDKRKELGAKKAGKPPCDSVPKELYKRIYDVLTARFPTVHSRVRVLLMNTILRDIRTHKAAKGVLPGWVAILLCHQSLPSSTRSLPIPFDCQNTEIEPPSEGQKNYRVTLRISRAPGEKKVAPSVVDTIELRCQGRRVKSQVAILKRIVSGEYAFRGSELMYDDRQRKWFVHLCYRMPAGQRADVDAERTAHLWPARRQPFLMRCDGRFDRWIGGRGEYVGAMRRRIFLQRRSRSQNHRWANTNRKGHGRQNAQPWRWKLQQSWNQFTKRVNHAVSAEVVKRLAERGVGRLVYHKPTGSFSDSRFLATAGKHDGWSDGTSWEFAQLETLLKYKCQRAGIEFFCEKRGGVQDQTGDVRCIQGR